MQLFKAFLETRNFSFEAYDASEESAVETLKAGLKRHAESHGLADGWFVDDDINTQEIETGQSYRDGSLIWPQKKSAPFQI